MKKYAVFYGPHDATLDVKHRLLVPSELKRCIVPERDGEALFAVVGENEKIWLMTENAYLEQAEQPLDLTPGRRKIDHNLQWFGDVHRLDFDGNGRILIPAELLAETNTKNAVKLVGASDHIQVWNRDDWAAKKAELKAARRKRLEAEAIEQSQTTPMPPEA